MAIFKKKKEKAPKEPKDIKFLGGLLLSKMAIGGAALLRSNAETVNKLNVFPVPDGDTGDNMRMTIESGIAALENIDSDDLAEVMQVLSHGMLLGARGNSGVILSLIFRGFSKGLKGLDEAGAQDIVNALKSGVDAAYKAVMKPTEGTILTVSKEAANSAAAAVENGETDPVKVFEIAVEGAKEALAQTPEILPVLKKAGVVDAGGQGLVVIFEGMLKVFKGEGEITSEEADSSAQKQVVSVVAQNDEEITFTYCTEFIVNRDQSIDRDPIRLRSYLETIGDCVVVVDDESIIKVHVHTDNPGKALQEGLKFGPLTKMKIENMREQHENIKRNDDIKNTVKSDKKGAYTPVVPENEYGFVAVAAGLAA